MPKKSFQAASLMASSPMLDTWGGMMIAPEADMSDGLFDVVLLETATFEVLKETTTILESISVDQIQTHRVRHVRAEPPPDPYHRPRRRAARHLTADVPW